MDKQEQYRIAPPGFTPEQWETFNEDGIIFIDNAISDNDIQMYKDAIDRTATNNPKYKPGGFLHLENIVERDPVFSNLIDHERHVGYAYDLLVNYSNYIRVNLFYVHPEENNITNGIPMERVHYLTEYFHPNYHYKSK